MMAASLDVPEKGKNPSFWLNELDSLKERNNNDKSHVSISAHYCKRRGHEMLLGCESILFNRNL